LQWTTADLRANGPVINVGVAVAESLEQQLRHVGAAVPQPRTVLGLIDTGASTSTITPELVADLDIKPHDKVVMATPGRRVRVPRYHVRLVFPPNGFVVKTFALMVPLGNTQLHCLIGRDVLAHADFRYDGRFGRFGLAF